MDSSPFTLNSRPLAEARRHLAENVVEEPDLRRHPRPLSRPEATQPAGWRGLLRLLVSRPVGTPFARSDARHRDAGLVTLLDHDPSIMM